MTKTSSLQELLQDAQEEREAAATKLRNLDSMIEFIRERLRLAGDTSTEVEPQGHDVLPGASETVRFRGMSALKAAEAVMREKRKPLRTDKIVFEILRGGYSKQLDKTKLYHALSSGFAKAVKNQDTFYRAKKGTFGLLEWQPQRKLSIR